MKLYHKIIDISDIIKEDKIFLYSTQASFYMIISAIPFITLLISLTHKIISVTEYDISKTLLPFLPVATQDAARVIIEEIFNKRTENYLSFSVISLLWTASRGISGIKRGLEFIYNLPTKPFIFDALISIGLVIPLIVTILLLLSLAIFVSKYLSLIPNILIGIMLLTTLFSLIYYILTRRKFKVKNHLLGSFLASLSWIIFIRVYSFYIEKIANYSYVYGSLGAILLLALWVYFSIIIFFFGAEINKIFIQKKRTV